LEISNRQLIFYFSVDTGLIILNDPLLNTILFRKKYLIHPIFLSEPVIVFLLWLLLRARLKDRSPVLPDGAGSSGEAEHHPSVWVHLFGVSPFQNAKTL
jgi:hypothetical protein